MNKNLVATFILSTILLAGSITAQAGVVINNTISGSITNTFTSQSTGNTAGLITETGATYGERFAGQTLSTAGGFDSLTGTPTNSLTLLGNATVANNIGILDFGGNVIYGDLFGDVGEGALSILLGLDTSVFGFNIVGSNNGAFTAQFFARDGGLLGSITESGINDGFYGFAATAGSLIAGVSITNTDSAGIAYDNFTFNQTMATVPEPGSLALLGLGLAGLAAARRRKSH